MPRRLPRLSEPRDPIEPASAPFAMGLGQRSRVVRGERRADAVRPLTTAELAEQVRLAQHGCCVDHVTVEGLREPVCILSGDVPDEIVRQATELVRP